MTLPSAATRRGRRTGTDSGLSSIEAIFTIPAIITLILGIVQVGLWWYATQIAATAAQEAARAAAAYQAPADAGQTRGQDYLHTVQGSGGAALLHPAVRVTRGPATVTVSVSGQIVSLLPWVNPTITQQATAPLETYVPGR